MSNEIAYSTLMYNYEKLKLNDYAMFDRVINLKLKVRSSSALGGKEDEFIIRSDYEIAYPSDNIPSIINGTSNPNKYYIQKCAYKPSIKVQYTQVSGGTSIGIDIFINNFFVMTKDGKNLMSFSNQDYKIYNIEILMGYIGQFNNCLGIVNGNLSNLTAEDLFNFDNVGHGVQKITINNVEYVQTDKLPPDSVLHIHGYVGNTLQSQFGKPSDIKYETIAQNEKHSNRVSGKSVEECFFQFITKRYSNFPDKSTFVDGVMDDFQAKKYGVQVFCSPAVLELEIPKVKDEAGNEISSVPILSLGGVNNTVDSAMQKILEYLKLPLVYRRLNTGNFICFTSQEVSTEYIDDDESKGTYFDKFVKDMEQYTDDNECKKYFGNCIPAVYNINVDVMSTIVCPFFAWIEPFQKLFFASRYAMSSKISYYADYTADIIEFKVINLQVSFATVEDVNEMQIMAVASKKKEI